MLFIKFGGVRIVGKWIFSVILSFAMILVGCQEEEKGVASKADFFGSWHGTIQVPDSSLEIEWNLSEDTSSLSIPLESINNQQFLSVEYGGKKVVASLLSNSQELTFEGELDGDRISGTFTRGIAEFPFSMMRGELSNPAAASNEIEVAVENGRLRAVLEVPEGEGPFPVALIIAGSGPTDRDGNSPASAGPNNSLKMLAEDLALKGIATLRYDKRGVGENMSLVKSELELTFTSYIHDASVLLKALQSDERFSGVGVIGHSEGSLIGMFAAKDSGADYFVSIAGAGRPIDEILKEQLKGQLTPELEAEVQEVLESLKAGKLVQQVNPALYSLFRPSVQPYMISWLALNPIEAIQQLKVPVLLINGTTDIQVSVKDAENLKGAKEDAELILMKGMNHILKNAPADQTANLATYSNPDLPLSPGLIEALSEFINN